MSYYSMELTEQENDKVKLRVFWAGQMFYEKEYDSIWIAGNVGADTIMKHRRRGCEMKTRKEQLENIQKLVKELSEKPRHPDAGTKHIPSARGRIQRLELEVDALKAVINLLLEYAVEAYE